MKRAENKIPRKLRGRLGALSPALLAELKRHRWERKPAPWSD